MTDATDKPLAQRLNEALGGDYTLEGEIGRGGMGVVYRARDEKLKRRVAIKVLPPELAFQSDIRARFSREAETAARLSHPHIVPIHTVGEGNGVAYIIMGYVDGESLGARLKRRGQLPADEARRIMKETADALSTAHAHAVIHRDIKPDNILLEGTRGRVMVTDFGIAKALSGSTGGTLTSAGVAIGTPQYMSPEQAAGEREIDGRSDLYSLGIVAYQMLAGEVPFTAPTVAGVLMKQITEVAPLVSAKRPDVPEDLALAIGRCLEKDPENRWATADALRRALESRVVTGYRPTGTGWRASARPAPAPAPRPSTGARRPVATEQRPFPRPSPPLAPLPVAVRPGRPSRRSRESSQWTEGPPDTGEPRIIQRMRTRFARWATVSGGMFLIDIASNNHVPDWSLMVAGVWAAFWLIPEYGKLWQAGYSWRDVFMRPPAPDAIETRSGKAGKPGKLPRQLPPPLVADFGAYRVQIAQAQSDRAAILKLMERLSPDEAEMLPEIAQTVDGLVQRATDLARTLHAMDTNLDTDGLPRIEDRIAALQREPGGEERSRRLALLERQRQAIGDLQSRRGQVSQHLESCLLAIQSLRFDLLRLRSAGINAVVGDLTQATQQARALSRDVDMAIAAAAEVREAMK